MCDYQGWMKSRSPRFWIIAGISAAVVLAVIIWIFAVTREKPPQVVTQAATVGDVEKTVLATGQIEPFSQVSVGAQVSGQVVSLKVELGDQVRKGELIAEIDAQKQVNDLQTSQAALANTRAQKIAAEATLTQAQANFTRQQTLFNADAGSRADYDQATAELKNAQSGLAQINAQIAQAQLQVNTANVNLGYTRIIAPMNGTVIAIVTKEGQTVNANQSAPTIVALGELDRMTVKAEISEADVIHVKPGQQVYFTILGDPGKKYYATLRNIEPANTAFEPDTSTTSTTTASAIYYYALFDVDNPDGTLRTSMTANVYIVEESARRVLTIPSAALGRKGRDGSYTVMVVPKEGAEPEPRKVKTGVNDGNKVQVVSGLKAGEQVVVAGAGDTGAKSGSNSAQDRATRRASRNAGGLGGGGPGGGPPG